jgi:nitrilase
MSDAIAPTSIHRVAVVQAEPEWLNLPACVAKTISLIQDASRKGASLIAFPECWIPGYPAWIWQVLPPPVKIPRNLQDVYGHRNRPVDHNLAITYIKNSLSRNSAEMASICACAKENSIVVVLGFSENSHNSLYIAQSVISATGEILMHRRKLKPTHMERTVFGDASGGSLDNVVDAGSIGRVGGLSCWEHTQPLLKYHTMSQREDIHVAAWPLLFPHSGDSTFKEDLFSLSKDGKSYRRYCSLFG